MSEKISEVPPVDKPLKLDYGQTFKVGFAFAIVMIFWSAYDFVIPLLLENAYGLSNFLRGIIMGLDNLLSLFMLPLFGNISDRAKGKLAKKFGRRTPFILFGTIASAVLMVFVPLSARAQQVKAQEIRAGYEALLNDDAFMTERLTDFYEKAELYRDTAGREGSSAYCDLNYVTNLNKLSKEEYVNIRFDDKMESKKAVLGLLGETTYLYDGEEVELDDNYQSILDNNAKYKKFVAAGMNNWISEQVNTRVTGTAEGTKSLAVYMVLLLLVLIAMATFRSPAVALMPDVTPKPLRSQANAVINLCGGAGGAIAFFIYTIVLFGKRIDNYIIIFGAVSACMLMLLAGFLILVKERKMAARCREICLEYGITDDDEAEAKTYDEAGNPEYQAKAKVKFKDKTKEEKAKVVSFVLILSSIFMWFMGYNAVSTSLSIYTTKALNLEAGVASVISGVSMLISAIAFIPVGFLAVRIGRRKSIMLGFALAVLSFVLLFAFVRPSDKQIIPAALFSVFYLISGFGLIIANVNTFPMVVELADAQDVGKYTGFYYTATMSAQAITPMLAGLVMDQKMEYLFIYSAAFVVLAIVLMFFVKHGDSKQIPGNKKLTKEEKKQIMLDSITD
jgi:maltose/moltooligosaccharide transporter